jgi:hypothetical protein
MGKNHLYYNHPHLIYHENPLPDTPRRVNMAHIP